MSMSRWVGRMTLAFVLVQCAWVAAEVTCAPLFADGMVLQRDARVPVWGKATPGEKVTVAFAGQSRTTTADKDGKWRVDLDPLPASNTPQELTVNELTIRDVLVGEVWVCSGQSNMQWPLKQSNDADAEIAAADFPRIRLATVKRKVSAEPSDTCEVDWQSCSPESAPGFSAVGYFFGRHLHRALKVPVGLIHASWGGTPAEAWTSREALLADAMLRPIVERGDRYPTEFAERLARWQREHDAWEATTRASTEPSTLPAAPRRPVDPLNNPNMPGGLYNAMIHPLAPYAIRGVIWYQGESNAGRAFQYRTLLPTLIRDWRSLWQQGDFAFLIVQLANFGRNGSDPGRSAWAELREAQALTARDVPRVGYVVTIDIGNPTDIHPRNKQDVGKRLGLLAERLVYGREVDASGPTFKSMRVVDGKVRVGFDHADGLNARGEKPRGFVVAGADRVFKSAEAVIDGNEVVVSSAEVPEPVAVRYGWANSPECNLYNAANLPMAPFRSDDWPGVTDAAR